MSNETGLYKHECYCDACGVKAYVAWEHVDYDLNQKVLTFCAHHGSKHGPALEALGWIQTHDDTEELNYRPIDVQEHA